MREQELLKKALSKNVTDKDEIYGQIVLSATKTTRRSFSMKKIVIIAAAITLLSITAIASVRLLTPREVAEDFIFTDEGGEVYDHFATPFTFDDSVEIGETRTDAGLNITFLGFAHGEGIDVSDLEVDKNKTYAVIAIENEDGSPIEMIETMLTVSPLVNGMNPGLHNGFTFGMSGMGTLIDGVQYQLMELEVIEYFAENHLYLSVSDAMPGMPAYIFDEESGEITANPDYEGVNVIFDLPIDPSKANSARVEEYLERFENPPEDESLDDEFDEEFPLSVPREVIAAEGELIFEQVVTADNAGNFPLYWSEDSIFTDLPSEDFETFVIGEGQLFSISGNEDSEKYLFLERTSETELSLWVYLIKH